MHRSIELPLNEPSEATSSCLAASQTPSLYFALSCKCQCGASGLGCLSGLPDTSARARVGAQETGTRGEDRLSIRRQFPLEIPRDSNNPRIYLEALDNGNLAVPC